MKPSHFLPASLASLFPMRKSDLTLLWLPQQHPRPLVGLGPTCSVTLWGTHTFPLPTAVHRAELADGAGIKVSIPCHPLHGIFGKNSTLQGWSTSEQGAQRRGGIAAPGNVDVVPGDEGY